MPDRARFNPFPGLRPFEPEEDYLFFGREKQIDELLRRLRLCRFLSVVGTSGSGKSSLIRSGLIPSLHSGLMSKAGSSWRIAMFRPGADPIGNLAAALSAGDVLGTDPEMAGTGRVLLEATLHRGSRGLIEAVRQARLLPDENVLVVVDQFEELFRFGREGRTDSASELAVAFVKLLLEAKDQAEIPIYIVVTMRSDFIGDCMEFPGLPEAINSGQYLVPRMNREELRSAITGPVAVGGAEITPRLVLRLLNEVANDHDQLPVLQHALMRTWDYWQIQQENRPLDISDCDAIGTMRRALSLHAEEAFLETGEEGQRIAERIFKALTDTFSDPRGIRRPTSISRLSAICDASEPEVIRIVEIFRRPGRSFLMPPPQAPLESQSIVDLSHESLMRCWDRLVTWAQQERASARVYARLSQAAAWFEESTAGLWNDPELELGLRWKRDNHPTEAWAEHYNSSFPLAMAFLDRSEQETRRIEAERERQRRNKLRLAWAVAGTLGALLVVAVVFFLKAKTASQSAEDNLALARSAVNESLSSPSGQQGREMPDVPQLEQFRAELLKKAEDFYSKRLPQQGKIAGLFDKATDQSRLGDIHRLLRKYDQAVQEYTAAIKGFEELRHEKPRNLEYTKELAYAHHWLAENLRLWSEATQNKPDQRSRAEQEYDSAMRLQQALHDAMPQEADYQQELARTYYNRGILQYDLGNTKGSESDFTDAIALLEPLATKQRTNSDDPPSHDLARVYNNLANVSSEPAKAHNLYQKAIDIQQKLLKDSDNWEELQELAIYYNNLAFLLFDQGDSAGARETNHNALDTIEKLSEPSPLMQMERAKAHMLHGSLRLAHHPEFHVLYENLAEQYVQLAREYLQHDARDAAELAAASLREILPELDESDRPGFQKSLRDLQRRLAENK